MCRLSSKSRQPTLGGQHAFIALCAGSKKSLSETYGKALQYHACGLDYQRA
jgi:hypothetical protein